MAQLFTNNGFSTLAAYVAAGDTTIAVATGEGVKFPAPTGGDYARLTLTQAGVETNWEVVYLTARTGDVLTITRAQEGTTALAWNAGDKAVIRITAGFLNSVGALSPTSGFVESPTVEFTDISPVAIATLAAGKRVLAVTVVISAPFDGAGANVTIGTIGTPDLIVAATDIDITTAGTYVVYPNYTALAPIDLKVFITPGVAESTGTLFVSINTGA